MTSINFLGYDIYNLKVLLKFKIDELMKKHKIFSDEWIKECKCECVKKLRKGITINCKHYTKALRNHFKEEEEKINKLSSFIIKVELYSNPQFPNHWLHRLKL